MAGKLVHLLCDLLCTSGRSTEVADVVECKVEGRVVLYSGVVDISDVADVIELVLCVEDFHTVHVKELHILLVIYIDRLDRLHFTCLDLSQECTLRVAVGLDRCDLRC